MQVFIGQKSGQSQAFLEDGTRIPVTKITTPPIAVTFVKTKDKHGYNAMQVGLGERKKPTKSQEGQARGAKLEKVPRFLREIRLSDKEAADAAEVGSFVKVADVLTVGDIVDVTGTSKGKGFAGVVKRHGFKGGPRTHGQSDRERAPGSIGQTTTPGRVYKGKRMAGKMGNERVTLKNLEVVEVLEDSVMVKGVVPGVKGGMLIVEKKDTKKKIVPLYKKEVSKGKEVSKVSEGEEAPKVAASAESSGEPKEEIKEEKNG